MRLVIIGTGPDAWTQLEPETRDEMAALERCAAGGEWTTGRGEATLAILSALAARIGHPVRILIRGGSRRLIIVRRGQESAYARLTAPARSDAAVVWDRREGERRSTTDPTSVVIEQRRRDRRRRPPSTWSTLGFLMTSTADPRR